MKTETRYPGERKPVAWREVHQRLDALRDAVEHGWALTLAEKKKILEARARQLARPLWGADDAGQRIEIIEFDIAYERYGIESAFVREVFSITELTRVPCTPPFVLGVINVRGEIVSVIDLKKFFDLPEKGLGELNKVVILQSDDMCFGILADQMIGVRAVPVSELQATLPTLTDLRKDYLKGVIGDRVTVLDAAKLLSDPRIIVDEHVAT